MTHHLVKEIVERIAGNQWQQSGAPAGALDTIKEAILKDVEVPIYYARLFHGEKGEKNMGGGKQTLSEALLAAERWEQKGDERRAAVINSQLPGAHDVRFMLQCYEFFEASGMLGLKKSEDGPQEDEGPPNPAVGANYEPFANYDDDHHDPGNH